jgi:selenide,water dikinase
MEIALRYDIHACTDITGFGLAGHALEMAKGGGIEIHLSFKAVPLYSDALEMYRKGETTGSNRGNQNLTEGFLDIKTNLKKEESELLFDPQTSGGLLMALPATQADALVGELKSEGIESASIVGEIKSKKGPRVVIL